MMIESFDASIADIAMDHSWSSKGQACPASLDREIVRFDIHEVELVCVLHDPSQYVPVKRNVPGAVVFK